MHNNIPSGHKNIVLIFIYALTVFMSAYLLFWIQPLISFRLTPVFGGTPNVWNTLLLFFQGMLLLGYLYSHLLSTHHRFQKILPVHIALIFFSAYALLRTDFNLVHADIYAPSLSVLAYASTSIGLPFLMLASVAPMVQFMFGINQATSPYKLYAVSNAGSLMALLFFPLLMQPMLDLQTQLWGWKIGYLIFAIFYSGVVLHCWKNITVSKSTTTIQQEKNTQINWLIRRRWAILAFIPSSLLHGVTLIITNDISSIPMLWVIPLLLYLMSFILAFSGLKIKKTATYYPKIIIGALFLILTTPLWISATENVLLLLSHLGLFFLISYGCNSVLYDQKPEKEHLTDFYLWIAVGGALGGLFNALIAPAIFEKIYEYPISIFLGLFILTKAFTHKKHTNFSLRNFFYDLFIPLLGGFAVFYLLDHRLMLEEIFFPYISEILCSVIALALLYIRPHRMLHMGLVIALLFSFSGWRTKGNIYSFDIYSWTHNIELYVKRNYFGIIKLFVERSVNHGLEQRTYYNGLTIHGDELFNKSTNEIVVDTQSYHLPIIRNAQRLGKPYASFGLGTGYDLCYLQKGGQIDFYEINPDLIKMAQNPQYFNSLSSCEGSYKIIEGDVRQTITEAEDGYYGAIISTASLSSSVPFHLLTKEAIELYLDKLAPGGALVIMTPANFFDFTPLFASYEALFDMPVYVHEPVNTESHKFKYFLFTKPPLDIRSLNASHLYWTKIESSTDSTPVWHDDFYNILNVIDY